MKRNAGNLLLQIMVVMLCLHCCANEDAILTNADDELSVIKTFFNDFAAALNTKDVNRIKMMSGGAWGHFAERGDCKEKIIGMEVLSVTTDKNTNVITRTTVDSGKGSTHSAEVIFTMKKIDGVYSIDKMSVPEINKRNQTLDDARRSLLSLAVAINGRNFDAVKGLVSFGDAADFEAELSARGLLWIKEAIDNKVRVPVANMSAAREGKDKISGGIYVPSASDGSNIIRKVVFKGCKIDRDASREETKVDINAEFEDRRQQRDVEERNRRLLQQKPQL